MAEIFIEAPAKVNMALDVTGVREDGYHLMRMINFSVGLKDELIIRSSKDLVLTCSDPEIPTGSSNLIIRIAEKLKKTFGIEEGAEIDLKKSIPMQAGLAGGSADGAAALVGLNRLWNLGLEGEELYRFGAEVGADIPYCCFNRPALVEGIGEIITPIENFPKLFILGVKPPVDISTPEAFKRLDFHGDYPRPDIDGLLEALTRRDLDAVAEKAGNAFEVPIFDRYSEIGEIKNKMIEAGARFAVMSGSGSTIIGYFESADKAREAETFFADGSNTTFTTDII